MRSPRWKRLTFATGMAALTASLAACSSDAGAQPTSGDGSPEASGAGTVWIALEGDDALTALDAATSDVVTTVTGISTPHNVQVGPDGTQVYAVSGDGAAVAAVDTATYELAASGSTGPAPAHVIVTPDGSKTYVTNYGDGTVSVFGAGDLKPMTAVEVGGGPHGARPTPDGSAVVVANTAAQTVDVIDTATDTKTASIPVGGSPVQVAVSPDSLFAYASISETETVVKIDLAAEAVTAQAKVSAAPAQVHLTPDGRTLLSADQGTEDQPGDTISLVDTDSMTVSGSITVGAGPHGVTVDPAGGRAWVTNMYDGTVSVLDLSALRVVDTVSVGSMPNGISFDSRPPTETEEQARVELPATSGVETETDGGHDVPGMSEGDHDH